jgi:hypothetical protein
MRGRNTRFESWVSHEGDAGGCGRGCRGLGWRWCVWQLELSPPRRLRLWGWAGESLVQEELREVPLLGLGW